MKKIQLWMALVLFIISACTYNSEEELGARIFGNITRDEMVISFTSQVRPIIDSNCAISNCHVVGTGLPDFTIDAAVVANSEEINTRVSDGIMPPATQEPLTFEEKDLLISWINQGAELD